MRPETRAIHGWISKIKNKYIGKRLPKTAIVPIKLTIKAFNLI
jgi:hypothetical protein